MIKEELRLKRLQREKMRDASTKSAKPSSQRVRVQSQQTTSYQNLR